jgi:hypothetical protein
MSDKANQSRPGWHVWVVQIALLCLILLHSVGLLHKHATAAEHDGCFACQVADHQTVGAPDPEPVALGALGLLLFLIALCQRGALLVADSFRRPHSRAPPAVCLA